MSNMAVNKIGKARRQVTVPVRLINLGVLVLFVARKRMEDAGELVEDKFASKLPVVSSLTRRSAQRVAVAAVYRKTACVHPTIDS